jgi:hypothetical protein
MTETTAARGNTRLSVGHGYTEVRPALRRPLVAARRCW